MGASGVPTVDDTNPALPIINKEYITVIPIVYLYHQPYEGSKGFRV